MDFLFNLLPAWIWLAAFAGLLLAGFLTLRAFGVPISVALSAVGGVAVAVFSGLLVQKGRQIERERQRRANEKAKATADTEREKAAQRPREETNERLERWEE